MLDVSIKQDRYEVNHFPVKNGFGSLGNKHEFAVGQFSGDTESIPSEAGKFARLSRFALQSVARAILPDERVAKCLRVRFMPDVEIFKTKEARFHYGGLITCGSVWGCPVCASKISERRKNELIQAMVKWKQMGGGILFLTQTIPHYAYNRLKPLLDKFGHARLIMRNRATWRTWAKSVGLQGIIKALEITHTKNGWHIHTHELLFVRPGLDCFVEAERLLPFWQSACVITALPEPNGHGLTVEDGSKASAYVTKWGIEDELTKAHIKKSKGEKGRTPFDFLRDILKDGDLEHGELFNEYYGAFKGKRQLAWSKGLRAFLGLGVEKTDEEIAAETEESASLFARLSPDDWRIVLKTDKRGELLEVAKLGKTAFDEFLRRLKLF